MYIKHLREDKRLRAIPQPADARAGPPQNGGYQSLVIGCEVLGSKHHLRFQLSSNSDRLFPKQKRTNSNNSLVHSEVRPYQKSAELESGSFPDCLN